VVYNNQLMVYNNHFMVVDEIETQIRGAKLRAWMIVNLLNVVY